MGPYGNSSGSAPSVFGKGDGKDKGTSDEPKGYGKDKGKAEEPKGNGKDKGPGKGEGKDKGKVGGKSWWNLYLQVKTVRSNALKAEETVSAVVAELENIETEMELLGFRT